MTVAAPTKRRNRPTLPLLPRLLARSKRQGECLVWTGNTNRKGYGTCRYQKRTHLVHRAAWIERHGPIPPETPNVLHHCDNPPCWADGHLFLGTDADNSTDMANKGRGRRRSVTRHCRHDHEYTASNTRIDPRTGYRKCRTCLRAADARHHAKETVA